MGEQKQEAEKTQDVSSEEVSPFTVLKGPVIIFLTIFIVSIIILTVSWYLNRPAR
jgi:hypothetical protein